MKYLIYSCCIPKFAMISIDLYFIVLQTNTYEVLDTQLSLILVKLYK